MKNAEEEQQFHPRKTSALFGHEKAESDLLQAYNSGRMAHAWLITGPRGVGKASLAYRFARFLLAQTAGTPVSNADDLALSQDDPIFRRVAADAHGGLLCVERSIDEKTKKLKSTIGVDDIRRLSGFFQMTSGEGGWRVVIIDRADEMTRNAANALLKLLEEPPERSILFLVSQTPGRLLPTIRSRCRHLPLKPLEPSAMMAFLDNALPPGTESAERELIAHLSEGCPGRAMTLNDTGGLELYLEMQSLLMDLPDIDIAAVHNLGQKLARPGQEQSFQLFSSLFTDWLARVVRHGAMSGINMSGTNMPGPKMSGHLQILQIPGEQAVLERLNPRQNLDRWADLWEKTGNKVLHPDTVNLDRRHVIVEMFAHLGSAARGVF